MVQRLGWMLLAHWEVCGLLNVLDMATHMTAGQCTHCSPPCIALGQTQPLGGPLAPHSGPGACGLGRGGGGGGNGSSWHTGRWQWQWVRLEGFKPSVKQKKREKKRAGSPDDCWWVQTGMGAGRGRAHLPLAHGEAGMGAGQGQARMGVG